jgi:translation initiation factor 3 subunit K
MKEQFKTLIVLSHYLEVLSTWSNLCTFSSLVWNLHLSQVLHLKTARFRQFWDEAAKNRNILEVVPDIYI